MNPQCRILIIEDDKDIREALNTCLQIEGYEIVEANHGQEALTFLTSTPVDLLPKLIILDISMPVMDGFVFLIEINKNHPTTLAQIPIIVTSAQAQIVSYKFPYPPAVILPKPFDIEELTHHVTKFCPGND